MPTPIVMPALGLTMTEGTIHSWLKRVGDPVKKDEPLLSVETDKAVMEVVSPTDGVLARIVAREGTAIPVQQVIAYLAAPGESVAQDSTPLPLGEGRGEGPGAGQPREISQTLTLTLSQREREDNVSNAVAFSRAKQSDERWNVPTTAAHAAPVKASETERLIWIYRTMLRIRQFDERIVRLFSAGKIAGALHSYVGEEAVAAGVCANLRPDDFIVSTHRGHGHLLAKGGDMNRMMAELFGRVDGYCRGKGGSMHITDVSLGILGANGIVGAGIPIAGGAGTAIRLRGTDQVVVCFFGDGAANIGSFNEGINLAAAWSLPVVYVCENNLYAQFTPMRMHTRTTDLYTRAVGYGVPGLAVDGNDAVAVAAATAEAIARARGGEGPSFIEAKTFRWYGHAINNPASAIGRDESEIASWKARDPIPRLEAFLLENGLIDQSGIDDLRATVADELEESIRFAEASPAPRPEEALLDVYTDLPAGAEL